MVADQRLELADDAPIQPRPQIGLDAILHRLEPQLAEAADLAVEDGAIGEIGVRHAVPQVQRPCSTARTRPSDRRRGWSSPRRRAARSRERRTVPDRRESHSRHLLAAAVPPAPCATRTRSRATCAAPRRADARPIRRQPTGRPRPPGWRRRAAPRAPSAASGHRGRRAHRRTQPTAAPGRGTRSPFRAESERSTTPAA
jgi:hypothetical protein